MLISFDLDGVIMDNGAFRMLRYIFGEKIQKAECISTEKALEKTWDYLHDVSGEFLKEDLFVEGYDWHNIIQLTQKKLGMTDIIDFDNLSWRCCRERKNNVFPGAQEVLKELYASSYNLIAITNGLSSYQYPCLVALGLKRYFEKVVTIDQTGYAKPRKEAFSIGEIYKPPRLHIGDSLFADVGGSNKAGWFSILYWPQMPEEIRNKPYWDRTLGEEHIQKIESIEDKELLKFYNLKKQDLYPDAIIGHLNEVLQVVSEIKS